MTPYNMYVKRHNKIVESRYFVWDYYYYNVYIKEDIVLVQCEVWSVLNLVLVVSDI
jgi:hypothetical protein